MTDISVCVAVYRRRPAPNASTILTDLTGALAGRDGELRIVLNGVSAQDAGVPDEVVAACFDVNRGVSVAWNAAAAQATGDVLCFCNDDVALGPGSLRVLHEALMSRPEAGVVSPVGAQWDMTALRYGKWIHPDDRPAGQVESCDVVAGFLLALRRETFEAVGGFDEAYTPCGLEEVDLSTAVRRRLGLESFAVAGVEHAHEYGISAGRPWHRVRFDGRSESLGSIHHRNKRHFAAKWGLDMPRFDRLRDLAQVVRLAVNRRLSGNRRAGGEPPGAQPP